MRPKEDVRRVLFENKQRLIASAIQNRGVALSFKSREEREGFLGYLNNYRATVTNGKARYPEHWHDLSSVSFIREGDLGLHIALRGSLSPNDKTLIDIVNSL